METSLVNMASVFLFTLVTMVTITSNTDARSMLAEPSRQNTATTPDADNSLLQQQQQHQIPDAFPSSSSSSSFLASQSNTDANPTSLNNNLHVQMPSPRIHKRATACPVHPDTPVIVDGKETYFDFDENAPSPAPQPGDIETLSCPAQTGSWWPGAASNLRASCPWSWVTLDTWSFVRDIYPRHITQAKCLCSRCVNAQGMNCKKLQRPFQFYRKTGCQGSKPVFFAAKMKVTVGCYCAL